MSLFKQLLYFISVLFLFIFSGNFTISMQQFRHYLQVEAHHHAQDIATSLGLSLNPYSRHLRDPAVQTAIQTIFNTGYYQEIKLTNQSGDVLVSLQTSVSNEDVPTWFTEYFALETITAVQEIRSDWNATGFLYVTVNPVYAHLKLYDQMQLALYYSLLALGTSVVLLFFVLRLTLTPLKHINMVAQVIASGHFARVDPLPWTTDVRDVAKSINFMAEKIETAISNLQHRLEALTAHLLCDDVTGLYKQNSFETDMKHLFMAHGHGYVIAVRVNCLTELMQTHGSVTTNKFLKHFATLLTHVNRTDKFDLKAYRLYGAEFVILMKYARPQELEPFAQALHTRLVQIGEQYQQQNVAHFGMAPFNLFGTTSGILAAAVDAREQARLIGANAYCIRADMDEGRTLDEWQLLVSTVIEQRKYYVSYIGQVYDFATKKIVLEEASTQVRDDAYQLIPIGVFVAMAEKFDWIVALDKGVASHVVSHMMTLPVTHHVVINLSMVTLKNADFRLWLIDFLHLHRTLAHQLVFSITAYTAAQDVDLVKNFIEFVHKHGARTLLKRYEVQFISIETVKLLRPDYIRLAKNLTTGIAHDSSKQFFVANMKEVGDLLGVSVIAESVQNEEDWQVLKEIGLTGASRAD